jgi:hypothetical protein
VKGDKIKKKNQLNKSSQIKQIIIKKLGIKYEEITKWRAVFIFSRSNTKFKKKKER